MGIDRNAIESFLYREARLMDAHAYDEWLALWDEDATYWVPCNANDIDPTQNVSVIYDRRGQLRGRIQRLKETSWLREQAPRLKRLVSNVEIESATDSEVVVNSAFILAELHHHNQYLWSGSTTHKLVPSGDGFTIRYEKVVLLNNNEPLRAGSRRMISRRTSATRPASRPASTNGWCSGAGCIARCGRMAASRGMKRMRPRSAASGGTIAR